MIFKYIKPFPITLIALLIFFSHIRVIRAQKEKEDKACTCIWLAFIYNANNDLSTSANVKVFDGFKESDDACEHIKNLCQTRNDAALRYTSCYHEKGPGCNEHLNNAENDFTNALNKIKKSKDDQN